jgi:hypothetical protein
MATRGEVGGRSMSRFESFQRARVFNEKGEPLYGQIFINDCIVNFENGFICNWDNEAEGEIDCPAVSCIDAHIEYWEDGVLNNKDDRPAVISTDYAAFWENGELKNKAYYDNKEHEGLFKEKNDKLLKEKNEELKTKLKKKGAEAELIFANYLDKKEIPFIYLCQLKGALFSDVMRKKKIKRPDYIIFIDKKPVFVDVKAKGCYTIGKEELKRLNNLKDEFSINVIFAITNKNKEKFDDFSFTTLGNINNYVKIIENDKDTSKRSFYCYSKLLLENKLIPNDINNDRLEEIYSSEGPYDEYHYSDIFRKYFKDNNYRVEESKKNGNIKA